MHFCAVWDDKEHTYVFVASTAPNWLGDEAAWTIRPAARSKEVIEGAPAAFEAVEAVNPKRPGRRRAFTRRSV